MDQLRQYLLLAASRYLAILNIDMTLGTAVPASSPSVLAYVHSHLLFQGFTLEFHFSPNEYFTDKVLTKSYEMRSEIDEIGRAHV